MSQPPQNWGPGPLGPPPGPGPNPPPPGPSSSPGAYGPGAYGPGPFGPGQGGPAYAPQRPPSKKSKLPLVLGIVGGVLVLLVGGVVFALMLFRAPTLPINRTIMIFEAPGVQVGPVALVRAKTATTTFGSSDACAKKLTAATSGSDSIVTAEVKSGPSAITARTSTAQETDRVYDALAGEMKDCRAPRYSVTSKGIDAGVANGVSYQRFVVEQTSGSSPRMTDLQLMKYGNTWSVVLSPQGSVSDPAAIARSYAERVRAAAK